MPDRDELLAEAVTLPPGPERTSFVESATEGAPELRAELFRLLQIHDDSASFLEGSAWDEEKTWISPPVTTGESLLGFAPILKRLAPAENDSGLGRLGPFILQEQLGEGSSALVFRALDSRLGRDVAIKIMRPEVAAQAKHRQRFLDEARTIASIRDEHLIAIHEVGEFDSLPYFVMEYLPEGSLQNYISRNGPLPLATAIRVTQQVLWGLQAVHNRGLLHRDIKPSNVLIDRFPQRIKLADFGLARSVLPELIDRAVGTPQFSSPEQIRGEPVDERSDLFSFGCLLYTLLVGRSPFAGSSRLQTIQMTLELTPEPIRHFFPEAPESLQLLLERLLAKQPSDRPESGEEVLSLLEEIQEASGMPADESRQGRRKWILAAGGALLLGGVAARYSGLRFNSPQRPVLSNTTAIEFRLDNDSLNPFLLSQQNAVIIHSEPLTMTNIVHYWRAFEVGKVGTVTYRFDFSGPLKSCLVKCSAFLAFGFDEAAWTKVWLGPREDQLSQAIGLAFERMEYWPAPGVKSSRPLIPMDDTDGFTGPHSSIDVSEIMRGERTLYLRAELFGQVDVKTWAGKSLGPAGAQLFRTAPQLPGPCLAIAPQG